MDEFLDRIVLNNPVRDWLIVLAVIFFSILFKKYLAQILGNAWIYLMKSLGRNVDRHSFLELFVSPAGNFVIIVLGYTILDQLNFPEIFKFRILKKDAHTIIDSIATMILIISFVSMVMSLIEYIAIRMKEHTDNTPGMTDNQLVSFFKDFLKVMMVILGVLLILKLAFHQDIGKVLAGLSIVGAAVALAARESIENIIASFIIFFDRPFTVGDLVKVNNITGTVEHIGLRSTRIRTPDKTYVTVPNKQMADSIIDNLSLRTQRRVEMKLELSLNTNSAEIKKCIEGIREILKAKEILSSSVFLTDITGQSHLITLEYMTDNISIQEFNKIREEKAIEIKSLLEKHEIEISGANLDVRFEKNH